MKQYDINGPHGKGRIEVDVKTGKPVQEAIAARLLRKTSVGKKIEERQEQMEEQMEEQPK